MAKIELGRVGAVLNPDGASAFLDTAAVADDLGLPTIWLTGGPLAGLDQLAAVVRATARARVSCAILSVDRFGADEVAALYTDLEADYPGRFVAGLGGAHGAKPFTTLNAYLDQLDARPVPVPASRRVLAALGPRMLDLARERAAGALPVFVTPAFVADARARLGDGTALAVMQMAVVEPDPGRARATARQMLGFFGTLPQYRAHFGRMGFSDEEIGGLADRFVDGLVAWGDAAAVAARVAEQQAAGADHVAVSLLADSPAAEAEGWRQLAAHVVPPG